MAGETGRKPSGGAEFVAEFVGTFMLVFAVGCNVITNSSAWAATSIAMTLTVMIYAVGGISGGHLNPAVSFAFHLLDPKAFTFGKLIKYWVAQTLGGTLASFCYGILLWKVFNLQPGDGRMWFQAGLAEFFYTFLLVFVVLNIAGSKMHAGKNQVYGLAIGFTVIAGGYATGHISGGCLNPTVAWAVDAASSGLGFGWCFFYMIFEYAGAAAAVFFFKLVRPEEGDREASAPQPGQYALQPQLISEFLGTFFLVLTVGLNVLGKSKAPVWSIAACLTSMICALGSVSGAHFNPAVTVAIFRRGKIDREKAMQYIGVQIFAGAVAGLIYRSMEWWHAFPIGPASHYDYWVPAYLCEFFFTFLLAYVVLCVSTVERYATNPDYVGVAIGACVCAGGNAIGGVSGGSLNPAVSFGVGLSALFSGYGMWHAFVYMVIECGAGVFASYVFTKTHVKEFSNKGSFVEANVVGV